MLSKLEKCIKVGICHAIQQYGKANKKNMKDHDKKRIVISYVLWSINLCGWAMNPKLPVNGLCALKKHLSLTKILQRAMMKKVMKEVF